MLRPREWIEAHAAGPGRTIRLDVGELGEQIASEVRAIGPCPPIQPGRGSVVTATFCHEIDPGTRVLSLSVAGAERPTGVTDNHPLWSASRGEFVPAGQLRVGELVDTRAGPRPITAITPRPYTDRLYNLETIEHVYRVGLAGTLVHNNGGANACGPGMAARGTHFHHSIPKEIQKKLPPHLRNDPDIIGRAGLPNRRPVEASKHLKEVHDKTGISRAETGIGGGKYNLRFQEEIQKRGGYNTVDKADILEIRDLLLKEFGI